MCRIQCSYAFEHLSRGGADQGESVGVRESVGGCGYGSDSVWWVGLLMLSTFTH